MHLFRKGHDWSDGGVVMPCHYCGTRFASWRERENHKKRKHGKRRPK